MNKRCACSIKNMGFIKEALKSEVLGKTDYQLFDKETADGYRQTDTEVMNKKTELSREENTKLPNGEKVVLLSTKRPLLDKNNNVIGILGNTIDITERKKMEEELRRAKEAVELASEAMVKAEAEKAAARAKADAEQEMRKTVMVLVGDIVHDLRTPIATIRTVTAILSSIHPALLEMVEELKGLGGKKYNLLNKKKWDYLLENTPITSLQSSVNLMDNFINSSLAELASAQKAQNAELTHEDLTICSSRRILENTLDSYPDLPTKIKIHQFISYDFYLMGNSILIMKILFNLIKNAIEQITLKNHGKGAITITTEEGVDCNLLKIKDSGGGAPPEVVANLFTGYFTTKEHGTGIGLAYCKKTMQLFGGDLTCKSIYGESMEFILSFPKVKSKNPIR
ncbi:MAG: hypothetical protein A3F18_01640 [Legionellales bacterium RIFCSPHIGHO2_12_FULL_37_14]|nr:MAG: hypothetical protein A3F18_01640 [Legionellales bacterium RIFCSPHIGHO2_12_FULL_37_14]